MGETSEHGDCLGPRTKKAWSPKIGGNDLELARWSSHQPVRNGMRAVLRTRTQTAMVTVSRVNNYKQVQPPAAPRALRPAYGRPQRAQCCMSLWTVL